MVEGQASDLFASDTDTWSATSSVQGSNKGPVVSNHAPLQISQSLGGTRVSNNVALVITYLMIGVCVLCVFGGSRGLLWRLVHDLIFFKINKMVAFSLYPLCI
jgi:hypothetical protein